MQPWLSGGVLRYAIVLSSGWIGLASIISVTCDTIASDSATGRARLIPERVIRLDEIDPCTNDPILLDGNLMVTSAAAVDGGLIRMDGTATLIGWSVTGVVGTGHHLAVQHRFNVSRDIATGLLEPIEVRLPVVDRLYLPVTVLVVRLQGAWDGSEASIEVTDLSLECA